MLDLYHCNMVFILDCLSIALVNNIRLDSLVVFATWCLGVMTMSRAVYIHIIHMNGSAH